MRQKQKRKRGFCVLLIKFVISSRLFRVIYHAPSFIVPLWAVVLVGPSVQNRLIYKRVDPQPAHNQLQPERQARCSRLIGTHLNCHELFGKTLSIRYSTTGAMTLHRRQTRFSLSHCQQRTRVISKKSIRRGKIHCPLGTDSACLWSLIR